VGGFALLVWLFKGGAVVNFVSETVLVGFKCGVALYLASTQLPKLFGIQGTHGDFWERMVTSWRTWTIPIRLRSCSGSAALAVLVLGKIVLPNRPVALLVVGAGSPRRAPSTWARTASSCSAMCRRESLCPGCRPWAGPT
jgi:MFS superfamily sulfate permease-like transporter